MSIDIRCATLADLPRVLDLCALLDTGDERNLSLSSAVARFNGLAASEGHRIYVAELGGEIVGTFALIFIGGLAHAARDSAVVEDVVVAADRRGAGIGRHMMEFAMRQCLHQDCYKVTLSSHIQRDSAHRFYEGLGFRKHGFSFLVAGSLSNENRQ
jgi:GNAT superfamily N-acetyltransferase